MRWKGDYDSLTWVLVKKKNKQNQEICLFLDVIMLRWHFNCEWIWYFCCFCFLLYWNQGQWKIEIMRKKRKNSILTRRVEKEFVEWVTNCSWVRNVRDLSTERERTHTKSRAHMSLEGFVNRKFNRGIRWQRSLWWLCARSSNILFFSFIVAVFLLCVAFV